jgi:hypothetical protein
MIGNMAQQGHSGYVAQDYFCDINRTYRDSHSHPISSIRSSPLHVQWYDRSSSMTNPISPLRRRMIDGRQVDWPRHRQRAYGHYYSAIQGAQRSLCHVVGAIARDSAGLLEAGASGTLAVSWTRWVSTDHDAVGPASLSSGSQVRRARQINHRAHAPAQLCHPSPGTRCRHSCDPRFARPSQHCLDDPLCTGGNQHHPENSEPAGTLEHGAGGARLIHRRRPSQSWRWRTSSAATARRGARPMPPTSALPNGAS